MGLFGGKDSGGDAAAAARRAEWERALLGGGLPAHVGERLRDAAAGRTPWVSTMTPAELLLARSHGVKPIATVSGTCWFQYGRSWTEGHASGWSRALDRIRDEAFACGANAVVDVKMRTVASGFGDSMDFTLFGTAVRIGALRPSENPVIATVPAIEFVRLLEMGIVPAGLAVGARYEWLTDYNNSYSGSWTWNNQPLGSLSSFWESVRREAHSALRADARHQGGGVLAHVQFGQLIKREGDKDNPAQYLGRHIVIGTVVHTRRGDGVPHHIRTVVDMRDDLSPLIDAAPHSNNVYEDNESDEAI